MVKLYAMNNQFNPPSHSFFLYSCSNNEYCAGTTIGYISIFTSQCAKHGNNLQFLHGVRNHAMKGKKSPSEINLPPLLFVTVLHEDVGPVAALFFIFFPLLGNVISPSTRRSSCPRDRIFIYRLASYGSKMLRNV